MWVLSAGCLGVIADQYKHRCPKHAYNKCGDYKHAKPGPVLPTVLLRLLHDKFIILIASTQPKGVGRIIGVVILKRIQARLGSLSKQQE